MSSNLDLSQVAAAQDQKEVTINDMSGELDAALTDTVTYLITSTNARTLTNTELRRFNFITIDEDGVERIRLRPSRVALGKKQHLHAQDRVDIQPVEFSGTVNENVITGQWTGDILSKVDNADTVERARHD